MQSNQQKRKKRKRIRRQFLGGEALVARNHLSHIRKNPGPRGRSVQVASWPKIDPRLSWLDVLSCKWQTVLMARGARAGRNHRMWIYHVKSSIEFSFLIFTTPIVLRGRSRYQR